MKNNNQKTDVTVTGLKKQLQQLLPDSKTFIKYITPYFFRIEDDYKKILIILKKIGVHNGVEGTWGLLCDLVRSSMMNENILQNLIQGFQNKLPEVEVAIENGEGLESMVKVFTWDVGMLPFAKELFEAIPEQTRKKLDLLEKKTKALPPQEQRLCEEFNQFVQKLYLNYLVTHIPPSPYDILKVFLKSYLLEYYTVQNYLYGKQVTSPKIIEHIKNIHIVGEDKLLQEIQTLAKPQTNLPVNDITQPLISFNYSNKEGIFFDDKIQPFMQIETEMLQKGFIKNTGEWATKKNRLVALIHIFYKLHYLKQALSHDKERILLNKYRRFFAKRYTINITKAFQPSQFDVGKLKSYTPDFYFVPEINTI